MLRTFLIALGVLLLVGGFATMHYVPVFGWAAALQFIVSGAFLLFVIFVEARRYGTRRRAASGTWESTGERFVDPSTGKLTEVRYNPQTGEREYLDAG
jgi:hypothetical protein